MPEVRGSIQLLGLAGFLQVASFHRRDLVMMLETPDGSGHLTMSDGQVIDAVMGGQRGVGALFPLLQAGLAGQFQILPAPQELPQQTITMSADAIIARTRINAADRTQFLRNPEWLVEGTTDLLPAEQYLQVHEITCWPVLFELAPGTDRCVRLQLAAGGIQEAEGPGGRGVDAIHDLMTADVLPFRITSPAEIATPPRVLDIAACIQAARRRMEEEALVRAETSADANPQAARTMQALAEGALDESARLAIARRYLPGGDVVPAVLVAQLTADPSQAVRQTALASVLDLPESIHAALANDEATPAPLLSYLLQHAESPVIIEAVLGNPNTPAEALVAFAPRAGSGALEFFREHRPMLSGNRELRAALRQNPACQFAAVLDDLDRAEAPRMRKRSFSDFGPAPSATPPATALIELATPAADPNKEKPEGAGEGKIGPKEIQYLAKRGTLRQKMELVSGNDKDVAVEIVSQPGVPESFILGVAESASSNGAALAWIGSQRAFRRNGQIIRALVYNPKTPTVAVTGLLSLLRPDEVGKVAGTRDLPDGTRQAAKQMLEKRKKKKSD